MISFLGRFFVKTILFITIVYSIWYLFDLGNECLVNSDTNKVHLNTETASLDIPKKYIQSCRNKKHSHSASLNVMWPDFEPMPIVTDENREYVIQKKVRLTLDTSLWDSETPKDLLNWYLSRKNSDNEKLIYSQKPKNISGALFMYERINPDKSGLLATKDLYVLKSKDGEMGRIMDCFSYVAKDGKKRKLCETKSDGNSLGIGYKYTFNGDLLLEFEKMDAKIEAFIQSMMTPQNNSLEGSQK